MIRALLVKELRECLPLAAAAAALAAWALHGATGGALYPSAEQHAPALPFVQDGFEAEELLMIAGGLAFILGFKQSVWEDVRGTYHYLLHRPARRGQVFLAKAAVGVTLTQVLGASMILVYGLWAARPGTHSGPFLWSMTAPAWKVWAVFPVIYLGALLCGLRPARWFGSRLLPLAACGFLALLFVAFWWWATFLAATVTSAFLLPCILYVARTRDF